MRKHIPAISLAATLALLVMAPLFLAAEPYTLATQRFESEDVKQNADSLWISIIPGQGQEVAMEIGEEVVLFWYVVIFGDFYFGGYQIEEDGILVEEGIYGDSFTPPTYDIQHLSVGIHTIMITAYDPYMQSVSDTVTVTVNAEQVITVVPIHEPELEIELGQSVELEWDVITDDFEWGYYLIYVDNELETNPINPAPWVWYVEEPILFVYDDAVSGYPNLIGMHEIRLWLYGPSGDVPNWPPDAFDITNVRIWPEEIPPVVSHEDDVVKYEWSPEEISWTAHDSAGFAPDGFPYKYDIIEDGVHVEGGDWENGVPIEYSLAHLSLGHHAVSIVVYDTSENSDSDSVEVEVLPPGREFMPLMLKLSGSFDYLLKEDIHLQLAAFLVDTSTGNPVTGATITFDLYGPDGALMLFGSFEEDFASGVYNYTYPDTFKDSKKDWMKGIYIVYAHATAPNGDEAVDMIQFHIDPPGGESPDMVINLVLFGFIGLLAFESLRAGRHVWKRRRLQMGGIGLA
jgi:hypothetical protein